MRQTFDWWLNQDPLSVQEKDLLFQKRPEIILKDDIKYEVLCKDFFSLLLSSNVDSLNRKLTLEVSATFFIDALFKNEVDDDTLVIYSNNEHTNVQKNIKNCKNTLELNFYNEIQRVKLNRVEEALKKFKKVFVYIIGVQISTGEVTPQNFFIQLKALLDKNNCEYKLTLDDVHGMFLVPRDYLIFDYVLNTAHALIKNFDMGILISKDGKYGNRAVNWLEIYLNVLKVILRRKEKLNLWRVIAQQYLGRYLLFPESSFFTCTVDHIASIKLGRIFFTEDMKEHLATYKVKIETDGFSPTILRLRGQHYIKDPDDLYKGLELFDFYLSNILDNF